MQRIVGGWQIGLNTRIRRPVNVEFAEALNVCRLESPASSNRMSRPFSSSIRVRPVPCRDLVMRRHNFRGPNVPGDGEVLTGPNAWFGEMTSQGEQDVTLEVHVRR